MVFGTYIGYQEYHGKPIYDTVQDLFGRLKKPKVPEIITEKTVQNYVTRQDHDFYDTHNYRGNPKAYINEDGYLVAVDPESNLPIHSQVRGSNQDRSPFISTTDPEFSSSPKNYGSNKIKIYTKQLQSDIEAGKIKNTEIITHKEIVEHMQKLVDSAQSRFDNNQSPKNLERLDRAKEDLFNINRDGETLIKGSVPPEYFTFE